MVESKREIIVEYRLKKIDIHELRLDCPTNPASKFKKVHYKVNIIQNTIKEQQSVVVILEVSVKPDNEDKTLGFLKVAIDYEVGNFDSFIIKRTNEVKFPSAFENELNLISFSTVRGIMYSEFKGTILNQAILPIIDPKFIKLIKNPEKLTE